MNDEQLQGGPGECDWCGAEILDFEEKEGRTQIRLHEMRVLDDAPGPMEQRREGNYVKVKVRCASCGHVNVVVGRDPRLGEALMPPVGTQNGGASLFGEEP